MHRDQLDLRGKTMSELQQLDAEIGNKLDKLELHAKNDFFSWIDLNQKEENSLLADRRQIRAAMVELRRQEHISSDLAQYEGI